VDTPMADLSTPFHYAVYGGQRECAEWIAAHGADVHSLNDHLCNAAQWAALTGNVPMLRWLKETLAMDCTLVNKNLHTVLHKACQRGHAPLSRWLVEAFPGHPWNRADKSGRWPADLARSNGYEALADEVAARFAGREVAPPLPPEEAARALDAAERDSAAQLLSADS
jgi:ankyrin repeat protein